MGFLFLQPLYAIDSEALKIGATTGGLVLGCGILGGASLELEAKGRFFDAERASAGLSSDFLYGAKEGLKASFCDAFFLGGMVAFASRFPINYFTAPVEFPLLILEDFKIPCALYTCSAMLLYSLSYDTCRNAITENKPIEFNGDFAGYGAEGIAKIAQRPRERDQDVLATCVSGNCTAEFFDFTAPWIPSALFMWRISKIK